MRSFYYLLYRWTWAFFFISVFIASLVLQLSGGKFFIFLTNWGIIACLLAQLSGTVLATRWYYNLGNARSAVMEGKILKEPPPTSRLIKFYWLVHGAALALALVITTVYWTFLHGKMGKFIVTFISRYTSSCICGTNTYIHKYIGIAIG